MAESAPSESGTFFGKNRSRNLNDVNSLHPWLSETGGGGLHSVSECSSIELGNGCGGNTKEKLRSFFHAIGCQLSEVFKFPFSAVFCDDKQ